MGQLTTDIEIRKKALRLDLIVTRRSFEKTLCDLPQCFAVISQHHGVRHASKHSQLPIAVRELRKEADEILFCRDSIIFAAHQQHRRMYLSGIHYGEICCHVEICPGWHSVAELKLRVCESFSECRVGCSNFVACEN